MKTDFKAKIIIFLTVLVFAVVGLLLPTIELCHNHDENNCDICKLLSLLGAKSYSYVSIVFFLFASVFVLAIICKLVLVCTSSLVLLKSRINQ